MTQSELKDKLDVLHLVWGTWANVANQLGVSEATVYRWNNGNQPIPRYVWMIADWMRVTRLLIEDDVASDSVKQFDNKEESYDRSQN